MQSDDAFTLSSKPPPAKRPIEPQPKEQQSVLFSGLHLLPGQRDLFQVDGPPAHEQDEPM